MKLDPSEKDILNSVEKGEWRSVRGLKEERKRYSGYAAATFRKDRRVNIRISASEKGPSGGPALPDADFKPHP